MDWPEVAVPHGRVITPWSEESLGALIQGSQAAAASGAMGTNVGHVYPFRLTGGGTVVKMFVVNGATASGNVDVGVYDRELNRLVSSGSVAQAGVNAIQEFDVTDTYLPPGSYWMALACSAGTFFRVSNADEIALPTVGSYTPAIGGALPLPATLTLAKPTVTGQVVAFGVSFHTLI